MNGWSISKRFRNLNPIAKHGFWSPGKFNNQMWNAFHHAEEHIKEFPELKGNKTAYIQKAWDFMHNPPPGTELRILSNGQRALYHQESGTILFSRYGVPQSFKKVPRSRFDNNGGQYFKFLKR